MAENFCGMCGNTISEGLLVCSRCESGEDEDLFKPSSGWGGCCAEPSFFGLSPHADLEVL